MSTSVCAAENEVGEGDVALSHSELSASSHKSEGQSVEEQTVNIDDLQNQSSSHSSSMGLNDCSNLSSSKTHLPTDDGKVVDRSRHAFRHSHPKRSRSANSVGNVPVVTQAGTDDVKPLTCKKHISGHKSSKQKAREVVAEKRSAEVVSDNAEKFVTGERVGTTDGSHDVTDAGFNDQNSADLPNQVKVSCIGESSIAYEDFSSSHSPVRSSAEELTINLEDSHLDEGMLVPSASKMCSLPPFSSSHCGSDNVQYLATNTVEVSVDVAHQCLPTADENLAPCDANARSDSSDLVQMRSVDVHELPDSAITAALDRVQVNNCEPETVMTQSILSSDCMVSRNDDVACNAMEYVHSCIISSSCANEVITTCLPSLPDLSSPSDLCITNEHSDSTSEPSCNISVSAASSSSSNSQIPLHIVESCDLKNESINVCDQQPLQNDLSDSLPVVPQESESVLIADDSFHRDSPVSHLCTDTASSENWSLLASGDIHSTVSVTVDFDGTELTNFSLMQLPGSATSVCHDVVDSPASPSPVLNDSILSPVGIDSSDSDSEVEWLETGVPGRQRCISISSGGSSIVYSPLRDVESVLSDTDSLEMLDDELQLSDASQGPSAEPNGQTHGDQLPQVSSAPLTSTSDVTSSVDVGQVENVVNSEQVNMKHEAESHEDSDDTIAADDIVSEPSDISLHINPIADEYGQDSDTDVEELDSQR